MTKFTRITCDTKIQHETWDAKHIANPVNPRSRRTRANAPIYNDIFKRMEVVVLDSFWKDRFRDAVDGIFPSKITYSNGILQHKDNEGDSTLVLRVDVDNNDLATLVSQASDVIAFYQLKIQMYSPTDIERMNEAALNQNASNGEDVGGLWGKMKPRQQEVALVEFIKNERVSKGLDSGQALELEQLVNICRQLKYTNAETIIVKRYRIINQYFLIFNPETKRYTINPDVTRIIKFKYQKKKPGKEKLNYFQKWEEFHRKIQAESEGVNIDGIVRNYTFPSGGTGSGDNEGTEGTGTETTTTAS